MEGSSSSYAVRELEPGPIDASVLYLQHEHRSNNLELMKSDEPLDCQDHSSKLRHITSNSPRVQLALRRAGFQEISRLGFFKIDHALITALVDRWRPETSTFHLPTGEITITLQDVSCLLGVVVEGNALTATHLSNYEDVCYECLGVVPNQNEVRGATIKMTWLRKMFENEPSEDASDEEVEHHARAVILHLIGSRLCPDHSKGRVNLFWLLFIRNLDECAQYSWGSAILSTLYTELTNAALCKSKSIAGCLSLLQLWSWTHLPIGRPNVALSTQIDRTLPYSARWFGNRSWIESPKQVTTYYRDQLDMLTNDVVVWNPYTQDVLADLPQICINGMPSWLCKTPIICMRTVEMYNPDRVMRQFGLQPHIPEPCEQKPNLDFAIIRWNDRHNRIVRQRIPPDGLSNYMSWYWTITRRFIIADRTAHERTYTARAPLERDVVDVLETVGRGLEDVGRGRVPERDVRPRCMSLKKLIDTLLGRHRLERPGERRTKRRHDTSQPSHDPTQSQISGPSQPPPTQD